MNSHPHDERQGAGGEAQEQAAWTVYELDAVPAFRHGDRAENGVGS